MKYYNYFLPKFIKFGLSGIFAILAFFPSELLSQSINVDSPNGGETWTYGQEEIITWSGSGIGFEVSIDLSLDGGNSWTYFGNVISNPNGGVCVFYPPSIGSETVLIRVSDYLNPDVSDVSDDVFTLVVPPIVIYQPANGSAFYNNSEAFINWGFTVSGINTLNAEISSDDGQTFTPLAENINASMLYVYLNLVTTPSDLCRIKLYNAEDPSQFGLSQAFTILPTPQYTIIDPSEGEYLNAGRPYVITWSIENGFMNYVYLEYSADNGASWNMINLAETGLSSGSYEWFTPAIESDECLIRISDTYMPDIMDTSEVFSIFSFPETPICMVTVDSITNQNVVIWERPESDMIADFLVYRETDEANVYEVIDTVSYDAQTLIADPGSNPAIRPYRYKLSFIDTEGRLFPASDFHQTIHLTINQGVNNAWNLIWTPYIGFEYSSSQILRRAGEGIYEQIATVSASFSSFTDFNAPSGEVSYMIRILHPDGCNPVSRDGEFEGVVSNVASNGIVGISDMGGTGFTVFPNPASERINISLGKEAGNVLKLTINDPSGRTLYSQDDSGFLPGQVLTVSTENFPEGIYILKLSTGHEQIARRLVISR